MKFSSCYETYNRNKYFMKNYKQYNKNASFVIFLTRNMVNNANESSGFNDFSKPEEPKEEDCCHSGCQNCVFDVYLQALERWKTSKKVVNPSLRYDLLSLTQFKPFILVDIKKLCDNTNVYTFKPCLEDSSLSGFLPYSASQYLALRVDKSTDNLVDQKITHLIRDFTLISLPHEKSDCSFEVLIKLYEGSITSNYIRSLDIGGLTFWRGPYGDFKYSPNSYAQLIMFCMGTGIAPMYALIKNIIKNESDETVVSLHFGCRRSSEIIFRDEIKDFMSFWNFNCTYYLSEEKDCNSKKYCEHFNLSKISTEHVKMAISNKNNFMVLVCGSPEFNNDVKLALVMLNIDERQYYIF